MGIFACIAGAGIFLTRRSHAVSYRSCDISVLRTAHSSFGTRVPKNVKTFTFLGYPAIPVLF